jgi:hypothetical protein
MKTETKNPISEKELDTFKTFSAIKDKISLEMANSNFEQIKEYLKTNSAKLYAKITQHTISVGQYGCRRCFYKQLAQGSIRIGKRY